MALKRVVKESNKPTEKKGSAFVSHLSGGLSIDFNSADLNLYLVGTEEGNIHRCSRNYQEQYLDTIFAHNGPIYRISWSPFQHDVFISCGADWVTRVWLENTEKPVFEFQNNKAAINDVVWSPHCSSVFGSVSDDGRLEIWDLSHSQ
jgi:WD40 repeat protein